MKRNYAYIDNQNLYLATKHSEPSWNVDMRRLYVYLKEKYKVGIAYLFMGAYEKEYTSRYEMFKSFGYKLIFREHAEGLASPKKGNVDTDIVFQLMYDTYYFEDLHKVVLISGDGDYFKTVRYLATINKLEKVLLPSHKNASSLYKKLSWEYFSYLDGKDIKEKLQRK